MNERLDAQMMKQDKQAIVGELVRAYLSNSQSAAGKELADVLETYAATPDGQSLLPLVVAAAEEAGFAVACRNKRDAAGRGMRGRG